MSATGMLLEVRDFFAGGRSEGLTAIIAEEVDALVSGGRRQAPSARSISAVIYREDDSHPGCVPRYVPETGATSR